MNTILLFGANGQLGQELVARAGASNIRIAARTRADTDIADAAAVERDIGTVRPDIVVNVAAYTKVDQAESEPGEAYRVNQTGAAVLASACATAAIPLVHISTDYVFDGTKPGAYVETDPAAPLGVYGASKLAGEDEIRRRHKKHVILRTSWVYGRYGSNFLKTILHMAAERSELRVVADQRGSPTSTADLAEMILELTPRLIADNAEAVWGTYHFTGDGETNWCQFADEILSQRARLLGSRPSLTPITTSEYPTGARRPANSVLDTSRFRKTFGLRSKPWRLSVQETVDALLKPNRR
jgi:dTDP-4-dehydrorhamnose reductase